MLTLAEAADELGLAASTLRHQVQAGRLLLAATLFGDDPAGLGGDVTAALDGDAAAGC